MTDTNEQLQNESSQAQREEHSSGFVDRLDALAEPLFHFQKRAADEEAILDLREKEVDGISSALSERTSPTLPGVDLSPLKQVDPSFDVENFRAIARETFYKVKDARRIEDPGESDPLFSPRMETEMESLIAGDVAAHRHHIMPWLTVDEAQVADVAIDGGREKIGVVLSVSAAEEDIDDGTRQLIGDDTVHSWKEHWLFERDPSVDTSASDDKHELSSSPDHWMLAHRGWVVTDVRRLD